MTESQQRLIQHHLSFIVGTITGLIQLGDLDDATLMDLRRARVVLTDAIARLQRPPGDDA
jgi:hypothetical protein